MLTTTSREGNTGSAPNHASILMDKKRKIGRLVRSSVAIEVLELEEEAGDTKNIGWNAECYR